MQVDQLENTRYHVTFFDATEFVDTYARQIMRGELFLAGEGYPAAGKPCSAVLLFPVNDDRLEIFGKVARVSSENPVGASLALDPLSDEVRSGLESYLTEVLRGETPPVRFKTEEEDAQFDEMLLSDETPVEEEEKKEDDKSLLYQQRATGRAHRARNIYAQVKDMKVPEKIKLAMQGGKAARAVLIKDPQPLIHQYVLKNPRITNSEIEQISKMPTVSVEVVRQIANNKQWMNDPSIRWNIVRNPKTNTQVAISHMRKLPIQKLKILAKSQNVKGAIASAAFKLVETKSGRKA